MTAHIALGCGWAAEGRKGDIAPGCGWAAEGRKQKWVDIGPLDAIPLRGARLVKTSVGCIAVFRTATGEAYALDDKCPHKAGPLAQGIVHGRTVTCPLHNWVISLETGAAQGADTGQVRTYALRVEAGRLLLDAGTIGVPAAA